MIHDRARLQTQATSELWFCRLCIGEWVNSPYNTATMNNRLIAWQHWLEQTKTFRVAQRYWLTIAFIFGFITDVLLLDRVDDVLDNIILAFYVALALTSMLLLYVGVANKVSDVWSYRLRFWAPLAIQYSFGGLLSGMFIFYGRSGDWTVSWPLLVLFASIMVANELVRDRASRLLYHLIVLFIGLFAYVVLVVPVFIGRMGELIFLLSGVLALLVMIVFIHVLSLIIPNYMRMQMRLIVFSIGCIFIAYNTLYFTNIIPPIPLSLTQIGIYQEVSRQADGSYRLVYEPAPWWQVWRRHHDTFRPQSGEGIYCFTSVFAPTRIETDIMHRWLYRTEDGRWVEHARIAYPIRAVGDRGYRGFTVIQNYRPGRWRCSVETARGQVLGRHTFMVDTSLQPVRLETRFE